MNLQSHARREKETDFLPFSPSLPLPLNVDRVDSTFASLSPPLAFLEIRFVFVLSFVAVVMFVTFSFSSLPLSQVVH